MLKGKRILITGANSDLGLSVIELLIKKNANLVLFYHNNKQGIDELLLNNPKWINNFEIKQVDLTNSQVLEDSLNSILESGPVDIFIHCPTIPIFYKDITKNSWFDFQSHMILQTRSFFEISKLIIPNMKLKKYGKIISILTSSVIGKPPNGLSTYITSKYALLGMSKCMAVELGKFGIRVNSISPSMMETNLTKNLPSKLKEITASQVPLEGKLAKPKDIAPAVLFLCSSDSDYISGENFIISGGYSMH